MKKEADLVAAQERSKENLELRRQKLAKATATRQKVDKQWEEYGGASSQYLKLDPGDYDWTLYSIIHDWRHHFQPTARLGYVRLELHWVYGPLSMTF